MIYAILAVLGLCAGSFANALVWRVHEQAKQAKSQKAKGKKADTSRHPEFISGSRAKSAKALAKVNGVPKLVRHDDLSILHGRSMCPNCRHELAAKDLVPVFSWLGLRGKCRYCHKPISWQYPLVELATAALFIISYRFWPYTVYHLPYTADSLRHTVVFSLWLILLIGFMALLVYDLRWMLLPNRIIYPLTVLAAAQAAVRLLADSHKLTAAANLGLAVLVGGGLFYLLFQFSAGKWIGGGDVKLGWLLGLSLATPARAGLMIFVAALLGSLISLPLLASRQLKRTSIIPFGPFLLVGTIIVQLFGTAFLAWYNRTFLGI